LSLEFTCAIFMSMLSKFYMDMKIHNFKISIKLLGTLWVHKRGKKRGRGHFAYITLVIKIFCKLNSNWLHLILHQLVLWNNLHNNRSHYDASSCFHLYFMVFIISWQYGFHIKLISQPKYRSIVKVIIEC
jgi:hypothetical protein